jgi:hypothetical protein
VSFPANVKKRDYLRQRLRACQQEITDPWTILYHEEKATFNK